MKIEVLKIFHKKPINCHAFLRIFNNPIDHLPAVTWRANQLKTEIYVIASGVAPRAQLALSSLNRHHQHTTTYKLLFLSFSYLFEPTFLPKVLNKRYKRNKSFIIFCIHNIGENDVRIINKR